MNALRQLRRDADLSQQEFAGLLGVSVNTFRMWDSGVRVAPARMLVQAQHAVARRAKDMELLPLAVLAKELGVHIRTLQAAARTGRLETHFSTRSVFGRPMRFASRVAGDQFLTKHYRCFGGQEICPLPLAAVPNNYDTVLRGLRHRLHLTQAALATQIGAAGKAVVYQWESRKRRPSPVLWQRIIELESGRTRSLEEHSPNRK